MPTPQSYKPPAWKYRELVAAFGGNEAVRQMIRRKGFEPPPLKTIAGWRERNSIPSAWLPLLIDMALKQGLIHTVSQLRDRRV